MKSGTNTCPVLESASELNQLGKSRSEAYYFAHIIFVDMEKYVKEGIQVNCIFKGSAEFQTPNK